MSKIKRRVIILLLLTLCAVSIMFFILAPKKIKFNSWGPGFVYSNKLKEGKPVPPEAIIITSTDDWNSYAKNYLIMIGPRPFPENKALLIISLPSAMNYEETTYGSYIIKGIVKRGNELIVNVNLNSELAIGNSNEIKSLFYEPFLIDLKDVSKETKVRIVKDK